MGIPRPVALYVGALLTRDCARSLAHHGRELTNLARLADVAVNMDGLPGVWHARIIGPFVSQRRCTAGIGRSGRRRLREVRLTQCRASQTWFQILVKLGKKFPNWRIGKDEFEFRVSAVSERWLLERAM